MIRIRRLIFAPIAVLSMLAGGLLFASVPALAPAHRNRSLGRRPGHLLKTPRASPSNKQPATSTSTNEATGDLYKFNANMEPENFTSTESNAIEVVSAA